MDKLNKITMVMALRRNFPSKAMELYLIVGVRTDILASALTAAGSIFNSNKFGATRTKSSS